MVLLISGCNKNKTKNNFITIHVYGGILDSDSAFFPQVDTSGITGIVGVGCVVKLQVHLRTSMSYSDTWVDTIARKD